MCRSVPLQDPPLLPNTRAIEKYVSLEVDLVAAKGEKRLWALKTWINGLYFFDSLPQQSIIFSWPTYICPMSENDASGSL